MKTRNPTIHWTSQEQVAVAQAILTRVSQYSHIKPGQEMLGIIMKAQGVLPKERQRVAIYNNASTRAVVDLAKELWPDYVQNKIQEINDNEGITLRETEKAMYPSSDKEKTMEDMVRDICKEEIQKEIHLDAFMNTFMDAITHPAYGNVLRGILKDVLKEDLVITVKVKEDLPVIAILGPNHDQQNELREEFKDRAIFKFFAAEKGKIGTYTASKLSNVNYGLAMRFMGHAEHDSFKAVLGKRFNTDIANGVSGLKLLVSQSIIDFKHKGE